jgi:hypothetical protein
MSYKVTIYLLTHSLIPWCKILFEKLIVTQLVKNIVSYGTRRFITVFTKARYWTLSWASWIQFAPSIPISLRSILMLSSHLRLGLPSGLLPSGLPTKMRWQLRKQKGTISSISDGERQIWTTPNTSVSEGSVSHNDAIPEIFTAMKIPVEFFWLITPCSDVVWCQRFGGQCCSHLQGKESTETLVSYRIITRCHNPEDLDVDLHRRRKPQISNIKYFFCML